MRISNIIKILFLIVFAIIGIRLFITSHDTILETIVNNFEPRRGQIVTSRQGTDKNIENSTFNSPWIQYRNDWNGEVLIASNERTRQILFPKKYREAMTNKGPHPLTRKYPPFLERLHLIHEHCPHLSRPIDDKLYLGTSSFFQHFNDDYEVIYCLVAKASSRTWIEQFGKMKNLSVESVDNYDRLIWSTSITNHLALPVETARRMQTFTKIFIHRHPFERLVSAYVNKFEDPDMFYYIGVYAKNIIIYNYLQKYPTNKDTFEIDFKQLPTPQKQEILKQIYRLNSAQDKFNITFTEFVNFITSSLTNQAIDNMDIHWKPATRVCNPCAVLYDVVIDHDNASEESQMVADYLQTNKPTNHPLYFEQYPRKSTRDNCNMYFSRLSKDLRQKLYEVYRDDFLLFGYECNIESESSACEGVKLF